MSTAQQLRTEGKVAGLTEGIAATLRLITRRFGAPDDAVAERIRSATIEPPDHWADRRLDAPLRQPRRRRQTAGVVPCRMAPRAASGT